MDFPKMIIMGLSTQQKWADERNCKHHKEKNMNLFDFFVMVTITLIHVHITSRVMRKQTSNLVSDQVEHKPTCTVTETGYKLEILESERRGIVLSAKLPCAFVFAYASCWFSHDVAKM